MVVISKKKYSPGDLISSELPFVHSFGDWAKSKFCDGCGRRSKGNELKKSCCSGCMHMYYCSKECQKKDWSSGHKYECDVYKHHYNIIKGEDSRCQILLRLYLVLKNNKSLVSQKINFPYDDKTVEKAFEDLVSGKEGFKRVQTKMDKFSTYLQIYNECNIEFDDSTMFELFCKCTYHSEMFRFDSSEPISATGLYLGYSSFSHSCSPNITKTFVNGLQMEVRASKKINIGDEIFTSLILLNKDKETRQKELKKDFDLDCNCQKCSSDFDKEIDYERMKKLETEIELSSFFKDGRGLESLLTWKLGKELIPMYKQVFGYNYFVTMFMLRMLKLYPNLTMLVDIEEFSDVLKEAVKYLKITHGVDHEHYKHFKKLTLICDFRFM